MRIGCHLLTIIGISVGVGIICAGVILILSICFTDMPWVNILISSGIMSTTIGVILFFGFFHAFPKFRDKHDKHISKMETTLSKITNDTKMKSLYYTSIFQPFIRDSREEVRSVKFDLDFGREWENLEDHLNRAAPCFKPEKNLRKKLKVLETGIKEFEKKSGRIKEKVYNSIEDIFITNFSLDGFNVSDMWQRDKNHFKLNLFKKIIWEQLISKNSNEKSFSLPKISAVDKGNFWISIHNQKLDNRMWKPDVGIILKDDFNETTIDNMTTAMKNVFENENINNDISKFIRNMEDIEEKIQVFTKSFNRILYVMKTRKTLAGRCDDCPRCIIDLF